MDENNASQDAEHASGATMSELEVWAGAPAASPPYIVVVLIVLIALGGPILFVHIGAKSLFLTAMALLLPIAAALVVAGAIGDWRRYHVDREVRIRALVTPDGVSLRGLRDQNDHYRWDEIADARVTLSVLMLHLNSEGGGRTRRAMRFSRLQTPVEMIDARLQTGISTKKIDSVSKI
ncbi:MAG TPA: hypothetical protein PK677_07640 [Acidiphilium sp.]|nr:MAG: hypothetical protein B7Z67_06740 [Acidiphilium sp. 21-60-14]OYV91987.1 MAG: hypothetical protein B7Z57_02650 [Acidiphilium sp. 37-60-79]OZB39201.1 MAG: hypothetical protein B7X48_10295 [Acidiphilium sp. 34-60-192]HQT88415.1 hypothetical protein [Acidiphilium sp.]HQU25218.1 hypothetical protein [Acidiphilium sp.]